MNLTNLFLRGLGNVTFSSKQLLNEIKSDLGHELKDVKRRLMNGRPTLWLKFPPGSLRVDALTRAQHPTKLSDDDVADGKKPVGLFMFDGHALVFNSIEELQAYLRDVYGTKPIDVLDSVTAFDKKPGKLQQPIDES